MSIAVRVDPGFVPPALLDGRPRPLPGCRTDEDTAFSTKPEPATRMIVRFLDASHHAPWVRATRSTAAGDLPQDRIDSSFLPSRTGGI